MEEKDNDQFPIGLKVLAIDANIVCLKYLVQLLQKCQYKGTSFSNFLQHLRFSFHTHIFSRFSHSESFNFSMFWMFFFFFFFFFERVVTATTETAEAIRLLNDEKEAFDIIITNVGRHDMDGFKILEIVRQGIDIPVVSK